MTRYEFLTKLKEALVSELDEHAVKEHVDYYNSYIAEALAQGRSENEVIAELGDPWVIARSIINMEEASSNGRTVYESYDTTKDNADSKYDAPKKGKMYSFQINSRWKLLLAVLGILGVVILLFAVIGGIISLLMPIIGPVMVIVLVFRLINRNRR